MICITFIFHLSQIQYLFLFLPLKILIAGGDELADIDNNSARSLSRPWMNDKEYILPHNQKKKIHGHYYYNALRGEEKYKKENPLKREDYKKKNQTKKKKNQNNKKNKKQKQLAIRKSKKYKSGLLYKFKDGEESTTKTSNTQSGQSGQQNYVDGKVIPFKEDATSPVSCFNFVYELL